MIKTEPFGQNIADAINNLRIDQDKITDAYTHSQLKSGNPHMVSKSDVGLGNVDNTSDADKPISTATQTELNSKVEKVDGKSLIADSEIERLASVHNYDDTEIKEEIDEKADKSEVEIASTSSTSQISDSADGFIRDFVAYGKCEQEGVPSPDNPQEIKAWDGTITTRNADGTLQSSVDLGISLYGIKVESGGNYIDDDGQQWLCDKLDLTNGVIVRNLSKETMVSSYSWAESNSFAGDYIIRGWATDRGIRNSRKHLQTHFRTQSVPANFVVGDAYMGSDINFWIGTDVCPDVNSWKAWLDSHELTIIYAIASSIEEQLTAEQINALRGLQTFADGTYVDYGVLEPFAEIGYWLGNKNAQSVADVDSKIPFSFGVEDGVYGYYIGKRGADTFHPFSSGGSSKPTYLIVNQGNGINVLDFSNFEETYYTNSEMMSGIVQIDPSFHAVFNNIQRNCITLVADDKLSVYWRRSSSYQKEDLSLDVGEYHLLFGVAESGGYAIVVC